MLDFRGGGGGDDAAPISEKSKGNEMNGICVPLPDKRVAKETRRKETRQNRRRLLGGEHFSAKTLCRRVSAHPVFSIKPLR